ncbi:MAG: acyl-CoA dehydrogenase family protein [Bacillota bacterium]
MSFLLNPKKYEKKQPDQKTMDIMAKTMNYFEEKGLLSLREEDRLHKWYDDFIKFLKREKVFATLLTPAGYGDSDSRFDLSRVCEYNEILGFYSPAYQYCYQVTILGLGPIWMGENEKVKQETARLLKEGAIFAFGLSERAHGADLYSNETSLTPSGDGTYRANGSKYYIGNANKAALVSTFGKYEDSGEFVFFAVDSQHRNYKLIKKIHVSGGHQGYVGEYDLIEYPITRDEILSSGTLAWDSALSTINIGKFQLGFSSIGAVTHALHESLNHAHNRILYGRRVTDFPHIKKIFIDAYARITAMKLYALRSLDYFRSSSDQDRRYLLFNPIQKMKVTTQGVKVVQMLHDVIAAKGFEQETFFSTALSEIEMLPRLEGTTHVNMAQIVKFMQNYFFSNVDYPEIPRRDDPCDDAYIFRQKAGKISTITFPDYKKAYEGMDLPNIKIFSEQLELLIGFLIKATPDEKQRKNIDYLLALGEMFTLVVYAQLILENLKHYQIADVVVDQIFSFMVREFSQFALHQLSNFINSEEQQKYLSLMMKTPDINPAREQEMWDNHVSAMIGAYAMSE